MKKNIAILLLVVIVVIAGYVIYQRVSHTAPSEENIVMVAPADMPEEDKIKILEQLQASTQPVPQQKMPSDAERRAQLEAMSKQN